MAKDYKTREATAQELAKMDAWARWSYDRNEPVVLFPLDGVITVFPRSKRPDPNNVIVLKKDGVYADRV